MNSAVIAALVTGGFALLVALYSAVSSYRRDQRLRELGFGYDTQLETRKSELARAHSGRPPMAEAKYEMVSTLYGLFAPLVSTAGAEPGSVRLLSFCEFERLYEQILQEGEESQRKSLAVASNPLVCFQPENRPVYWRLLMTQACLYQALLRTSRDHRLAPVGEDAWLEYLRLENPADYSWKAADHTPALDDTLHAVTDYLRRYVIAPRIINTQRAADDK